VAGDLVGDVVVPVADVTNGQLDELVDARGDEEGGASAEDAGQFRRNAEGGQGGAGRWRGPGGVVGDVARVEVARS
jgi:hypothetical protein